MLLQVAIDDPNHLGVIPLVLEYVDVVEIGTPLLKTFGLSVVSLVRQRWGEVPILVDSKTVDVGAREAAHIFGAGASFMTVLVETSPATHAAVSRVAAEQGGLHLLAQGRIGEMVHKFSAHK